VINGLDPTVLALLVPLVLIELGLVVAALWDLTRPGRRVRGDSRPLWALIILLVSMIGPILYFVVGREESVVADEAAGAPRPPAPDAVAGWQAPTRPSTDAGSGGGATATAPGSPAVAGSASPSTATPTTTVAPPPPVAGPRSGQATFDGVAPVISCRGLSKLYGGPAGVLALDGLDLDVPTGSIFGLLGPNGAGKTTTLRLITGLGHRTGGSATVAGVPIDGGGPALARHIGYLDQDPRYYGWLTGRELVTMVAELHGLVGAPGRERAAEVLGQVGLAGAADRRIATYSGGMLQRIGIAQALVNRPSVLILDEPVSSLDPEGRRDLLELIADFRGSATVLFSTHVLSDVERICDRIAILDHGRLVTEGPLEELLDRYAQPIFRLDPEPGQETAVAALVETLRGADWVTAVDVAHGALRVTVSDPSFAGRELLPAVVAAGLTLATYERVRPTLEDVFLRLVGRGTGEVPA
jgi:ABC-2 type transport system ATP-binding protein